VRVTLVAGAAVVDGSVAVVVKIIIAVLCVLGLPPALAGAPLSLAAGGDTHRAYSDVSTAGFLLAAVAGATLVGITVAVVICPVAGLVSPGKNIRPVVVAVCTVGAAFAKVAETVMVEIGAIGLDDAFAVAADEAGRAVGTGVTTRLRVVGPDDGTAASGSERRKNN